MNISIREESVADFDVITNVTVEAFKTLDISSNTEHFIVTALRDAGTLAVSLVAELNGRVVGHIAFSPVTISDGTSGWYGLGPVSVVPELHNQGIGSALIEEGLLRLRDLNAKGCCLVGYPDFYGRFGFRQIPGLVVEGIPEETFLCLVFNEQSPQGRVTFHESFNAGS